MIIFRVKMVPTDHITFQVGTNQHVFTKMYVKCHKIAAIQNVFKVMSPI